METIERTRVVIAEEALTGLTLHDYCDAEKAGNVQAYVRVHKDGQVLDFCKHHFEVHEPTLIIKGYKVVDDRRTLLQEKSKPQDDD